MKHKSVLLKEVMENLNVRPKGTYIDCTLGYAGHSTEILKKMEGKGFLFAFDQDIDAVNYSSDVLSNYCDSFVIINSNFKDIKQYIDKKVDGILFDLGVSSPQLDEEERGFSFHKDAVLDMRMDRTKELDAKKVVNEYSVEKLTEILFKYGEEKYAKSIAKGIVTSRPINTTLELVEVIKKNVPASYRNDHHPARKTFQAIRIEVNDEINILYNSLKDAFDLLNVGGRLCVITFHSLEDKEVAKVFKELCSDDLLADKLPIVPDDMKRKAINICKITPSEEELNENPRSRSSKLRVIERIR